MCPVLHTPFNLPPLSFPVVPFSPAAQLCHNPTTLFRRLSELTSNGSSSSSLATLDTGLLGVQSPDRGDSPAEAVRYNPVEVRRWSEGCRFIGVARGEV